VLGLIVASTGSDGGLIQQKYPAAIKDGYCSSRHQWSERFRSSPHCTGSHALHASEGRHAGEHPGHSASSGTDDCTIKRNVGRYRWPTKHPAAIRFRAAARGNPDKPVHRVQVDMPVDAILVIRIFTQVLRAPDSADVRNACGSECLERTRGLHDCRLERAFYRKRSG